MSLLPVGFGASGDDYEITDSLRLRSSASAYLSRTPATAGNRRTWTWSGWVKRSNFTIYTNLFDASAAAVDQCRISFTATNDKFQVDDYNDGFDLRLQTSAQYRDPSAWYHFVVSVDTTQATSSNRASIYVNGVKQTSFSNEIYPPQNHETNFNNTVEHNISRRIYNNDYFLEGYLTEVNWIDGQALTADDFGEYDANGTWKAKEYTGTYGTNGFYLPMKPTTQAELQNTVLWTGTGDTQSIDGVGFTPDLVWIKNRTDATNNHNLFDTVRGVNKFLASNLTSAETTQSETLTSFDSDGFTVRNAQSVNRSGYPIVGWCWDAGDNQPSTGHSSILYKGSGGAISLKGFGFSPDLVWIKNRDGTAQNHMLFDSVRGPNLRIQPDNTATEFNQTNSLISFDTDGFSFGTSTGNLNSTSSNYVAWGWDAGDGDPVSNTDGSTPSTLKASDATGFSIVTYTGTGSAATVGHGLSTAPDIIIVKERTSTSGWVVYTSMTGAGQYLSLHSSAAASSSTNTWNNTTPTSSVFSLNTSGANNQSSQNYVAYCFSEVSGVSKFDSYTGTGSGGHTITTGFRPGFVMIKRTDSANSWVMIDATRDPFNIADSILWADLADAEASGSTTTSVNFTDTGFELNGAGGSINASGGTYIYMAFKGSYSDYVSPLNDTGTIDSRVKANPDKGFSIVSYEGTGAAATVGHGLSSPLEMLIVKSRDDPFSWGTWHTGIAATEWLKLQDTAAKATLTTAWNSTAPTNSVFSLGSSGSTNNNNSNFIAYCFHSVAGYSKFDSYIGNGSTTGPVVTTGFRPAFVMIKKTNGTDGWYMFDSTRSPFNPIADALLADNAIAEFSNADRIEFTDTGFQLKTSLGPNELNGNYIYMAFADTADARFNFDASGNKNNWLPNNINSNAESETTYDLMKDTPSLVDENAGNFATLNPLDNNGVALTEANLTGVIATNENVSATIAPTSGKWYWEVYIVDSTNPYIGVKKTESNITGYSGDAVGINTAGDIYFNGSNQGKDGLPNFSNGDVVGVGLDVDAQKIWWSKNGQWYTADAATESPIASSVVVAGNNGYSYGSQITNVKPYVGSSTTTGSVSVNFGQRPFAYTPPTGFLKLNTFNLPDSTIEDGSDYFAPLLYDGAGGSQTITGLEFQPDWVWIKSRSAAYTHGLFDSNRGVQKLLQSNSTAAEITNAIYLTSFNSDGFSIGGTQFLNGSGETFVSWNWKANGSGVSNTDGSITSTVSANTTAGFSIVSFAAQSGTYTVGHGLNSPPEIILGKNRNINGGLWYTQTTLIDGTVDYLSLNSTAAAADAQGFGFVAPTSTVFTGDSDLYYTTGNMITYCFHSVEGYSAFGSYTGNGSADGPFVYTGFRPAFVMFKRTNGSGMSWAIRDTTRDPYNASTLSVFADLSNAESSGNTHDILSNGFKLRSTSGNENLNGGTYIYMAFAENPFKNALAR